MKYYDELNSFITIYGIQEKLENIYYIDETNIALEHNPSKVICQSKHQAITSARAQNVALIDCGNAKGNFYEMHRAFLPLFIFPGKRWNHVFIERTCAETKITFRQWLVLYCYLMKYLQNNLVKFVNPSARSSPILLNFD